MESRACLANLADKAESQPRKHKGRGEDRSVQPAEVTRGGLERTSKVEGSVPRL